nr:methyltransferase-like protein 13 [Ipomoea batatas]
MSLHPATFETIVPSRHITFTLPNPLLHLNHFNASLLRVAVLDSPTAAGPAMIAAMLVPLYRESDWTFSTEPGHLQLLLSFPHLSRLVLIGNSPDSPLPTSYKPPLSANAVSETSVIEESLMPLLIALSPKEAFHRTGGGLPQIPFLSYEDEVIRSVVLEICVGDRVGEMLVEDVGLAVMNGDREFRRRLRFKRMPNLIQTQMRIHPNSLDFQELETVELRLDNGILVHPYLTPMVAGLSVVASYLDNQIQSGFRPKALCLGVGGGALLSFLNAQLGFEVLGIEEDEAVLRIARKYFGLKDSESMHLCVGDGIQMIEKLGLGVPNGIDARTDDILDKVNGKFNAIMVDLDSSDARMGTSAPPPEFVQKSILFAAKTLLSEHGVLIINVIPPCKRFYETLTDAFQDVLEELYEIDVADKENFVVIATVSQIQRVSGDADNTFLSKLKSVLSGSSYIDSIRVFSSATAAIDGG